MDENISLQDLFKILRKRLLLILTVSMLTVILVGLITYFFVTPLYKASTQILITQKNELNQFNSQDIQTNLQLINTYNVIIKSPAILSKVIENLEIQTTPTSLNKIITVSNEQNSQVVNISVKSPNPEEAAEISNMIAVVFQKEIQHLMNVDNVHILSPALDNEKPVSVMPGPAIIMVISSVIGLAFGIGFAVLIELLDTTVKSDQDIEEIIGLVNLGLISTISKKETTMKREALSRRKKRGLKVV